MDNKFHIQLDEFNLQAIKTLLNLIITMSLLIQQKVKIKTLSMRFL